MKLTLNIPDVSSNKAISLIEYLNSLDFITIETEEELPVPDWHKQIVRERISDSVNEKPMDWDLIKESFKLD
ncbi:MAG: hypothetical protein CFE21_11665 [Bacteroidetes bacterium B1(2017)]|nr:MAG: hypothetical protein CFE21_11665 [Bacteroidetes bacterium B1(2017)]